MSSIPPSLPPPLSFRDHSVNAVLSHVHRAGLVSRSELARAVGLNRSSIARVLAELTERGLIEPAGAARGGSRGRPSLLVQASPDGPVALAAQILPDATVVAAGGLGGQLLLRDHHQRPRGLSAAEQVATLLGDLLRRYRRQGVVSAVIATAGGDDPALHDAVAVSLTHAVPVRDVAAADVAAVGEQRRGAGTGLSNVLYVTAQPEATAGMVLDGQLFRGASGGAGRIAHLTVNPGGARCACGRRGCLGVEVDLPALLRPSRRGATSGDEGLEAALRAARAGDRRTLRALERIGGFLGVGLAQLTSILNPDAVVLGGYLAPCLPFLGDSIAESMAVSAAPPARILGGALGDDAAVVGAIEIGLQPLFAPAWTPSSAVPDPVPSVARVAG